nr:hypothetical protein CFP56_70655 [Quercus suber]
MARRNNRPSDLPGARHEATHSASRYNKSPVSGNLSDEENIDPSSIRKNKGKGRAEMPSQSRSDNLPTPNSDTSDNGSRGQKRKRGTGHEDGADFREQAFNRYFDPHQDPDVRRDIKRKSRLLEREFNGRLC